MAGSAGCGKTPRTSPLLVRLSPGDDLKALRSEAAAADVSMSNLVSRAVRELREPGACPACGQSRRGARDDC